MPGPVERAVGLVPGQRDEQVVSGPIPGRTGGQDLPVLLDDDCVYPGEVVLDPRHDLPVLAERPVQCAARQVAGQGELPPERPRIRGVPSRDDASVRLDRDGVGVVQPAPRSTRAYGS